MFWIGSAGWEHLQRRGPRGCCRFRGPGMSPVFTSPPLTCSWKNGHVLPCWCRSCNLSWTFIPWWHVAIELCCSKMCLHGSNFMICIFLFTVSSPNQNVCVLMFCDYNAIASLEFIICAEDISTKIIFIPSVYTVRCLCLHMNSPHGAVSHVFLFCLFFAAS